MTYYLKGAFTDGETNYGDVYAIVTDVTKPKDGSYCFAVSAFTDSAFTKNIYTRGSQLLDYFGSEDSTSVELRALTKFRDALAPEMVLIQNLSAV